MFLFKFNIRLPSSDDNLTCYDITYILVKCSEWYLVYLLLNYILD